MNDAEKYSDVLLHAKEQVSETEFDKRVIFPFTRYQNVINAPRVSKNFATSNNPSFMLYVTDEGEIDDAVVFNLFGCEW